MPRMKQLAIVSGMVITTIALFFGYRAYQSYSADDAMVRMVKASSDLDAYVRKYRLVEGDVATIGKLVMDATKDAEKYHDEIERKYQGSSDEAYLNYAHVYPAMMSRRQKVEKTVSVLEKLNSQSASLEAEAVDLQSELSGYEFKSMTCGRSFGSGDGSIALECFDNELRRKSVLLVSQDQFAKMSFPAYGDFAVTSEGARQYSVTNSTAFQTWNTSEVVSTYRLHADPSMIREKQERLSAVPKARSILEGLVGQSLEELRVALAPNNRVVRTENLPDGGYRRVFHDGSTEDVPPPPTVPEVEMAEWKFSQIKQGVMDEKECGHLYSVLSEECIFEPLGGRSECSAGLDNLPRSASYGLIKQGYDKGVLMRLCATACYKNEAPNRRDFYLGSCLRALETFP